MPKKQPFKLSLDSVSFGSASCSVYVDGIEMNCPLCGVTVQPREQHYCERVGRSAPPLSVKKAKKKGAR